MTMDWKTGGMCSNCTKYYKLEDFGSCMQVFTKLFYGLFEEKRISSRVVRIMDDYIHSLNRFAKYLDCI